MKMSSKDLVDGVEYNRLDYILRDLKSIYVDYMKDEQQVDLTQVHSLIAAIQADCAEGHMAQNDYYHTGYFRVADEYMEKGYYDVPSIGISISGEDNSWWISIYGDSRHTIKWLEDQNLLVPEVRIGNIRY